MKREHEEESVLEDQSPKKPKTETRAHSVGLTQFINHGFAPISGQFKSRMEDFSVTEVDRDGTECRLKSFETPEVPPDERNKSVQLVELSDDVVTGLNQVVAKDVPSYLIPAPVEKVERTSLHKSIASFSDLITSETVKEGNDSFIKVSIKSKSSFGSRDRVGGRNSLYLHFTLLKWNITTAESVMRLSKVLHVKPKNFSYAGLKDKRGITSQRMSCRFLEPKRLAGLNRKFFEANKIPSQPVVYHNNFVMGDYQFSKSELKLGEMSGNKFSVVLRECEEIVHDNLSIIRTLLLENGFINYFGLQRFGNDGNTHEIGRHILKKDYKGAVERILTSNDRHKADVTDSLVHYKTTGDANRAYEMLKYKSSVEGLLLQSLGKEGTNYKRALKSLHYKQQTLYTHAYQSYVWNRLVSRRISTHGTQVLEGDLVYEGVQQDSVRRLTAPEVSSVQFSDVVLPMPGYDIQIPDNSCGDFLSELLEQDGMSLEDFSGPLGKEFNVSGCYRKLIYKPSEFNADVIRYSDEHEKLVFTDVDSVLNKSFEAKNAGDKIALRLQFTLPKSCYATMLLREITRNNSI